MNSITQEEIYTLIKRFSPGSCITLDSKYGRHKTFGLVLAATRDGLHWSMTLLIENKMYVYNTLDFLKMCILIDEIT
jgi:hypothetical protein